ncbi:vanadium-dependent haloperoxidase [Thermomonospora umbrina]|nr:vanadium-dependent haloperoxidase [Thermomonospora umbrina]
MAASLIGVLPGSAAAATIDHTVYWNGVLQQAYREATGTGAGPTTLSRAGAIMHLAMYDAANSAKCTVSAASCLGKPYLTKVTVPAGQTADMETAIDHAAHRTLTALFGARFDDELTGAQNTIDPSVPQAQRDQARSIGLQVAQAMLDDRADDGSANDTPYTAVTGPGHWRATSSGPALGPNWGAVRPFAMTSGSQFRPGPPGGFASMGALLASDAYKDQVAEVARLGSVNSSQRTADQRQQAFFWANDVDGTYKPPGHLFELTEIIAKQEQVSPSGRVKLFAMVAMAMADAVIAAWDAKYRTDIDLWRPESAIRHGDQVPGSVHDPYWSPLSVNAAGQRFSPPFPAYVSGHATLGGAWAKVMSWWFFGNDNITFTATTDDPNAQRVTRQFTSFSAAALENARSRIYLGVHYQWDADSGIQTGNGVSDHVTAGFLGVNQSSTWLRFGNGTQSWCESQGQKFVDDHRWAEYQCVAEVDRWILSVR